MSHFKTLLDIRRENPEVLRPGTELEIQSDSGTMNGKIGFWAFGPNHMVVTLDENGGTLNISNNDYNTLIRIVKEGKEESHYSMR